PQRSHYRSRSNSPSRSRRLRPTSRDRSRSPSHSRRLRPTSRDHSRSRSHSPSPSRHRLHPDSGPNSPPRYTARQKGKRPETAVHLPSPSHTQVPVKSSGSQYRKKPRPSSLARSKAIQPKKPPEV